MLNEYPVLLTVDDVCNILDVERHSVYTLISSGEIEAIKANRTDWRITKDSLILYVLRSSGLDIEKEEIYDYI